MTTARITLVISLPLNCFLGIKKDKTLLEKVFFVLIFNFDYPALRVIEFCSHGRASTDVNRKINMQAPTVCKRYFRANRQ